LNAIKSRIVASPLTDLTIACAVVAAHGGNGGSMNITIDDPGCEVFGTPMVVYDGTRALGEIEDHGRSDIQAWLGVGDERVSLGTVPDRKAAMRAVSEAAQAATIE
jgi:hypothetical protein